MVPPVVFETTTFILRGCCSTSELWGLYLGITMHNLYLPVSGYLVLNGQYIGSSDLKKKLLRENIFVYECFICHIKEWQNKTLVLELDHINGNKHDNCLENLRLLCPNCHSQTPTYRSKNRKTIRKRQVCTCKYCKLQYKSDPSKFYQSIFCSLDCFKKNKHYSDIRPSKDILQKEIWETPVKKLSIKYGVVDSAIKKWIKYYKLSNPPRGYWNKKYQSKLCPVDAKQLQILLNQLPMVHIAHKFNVSEGLVRKWMKSYSINGRGSGSWNQYTIKKFGLLPVN